MIIRRDIYGSVYERSLFDLAHMPRIDLMAQAAVACERLRQPSLCRAVCEAQYAIMDCVADILEARKP